MREFRPGKALAVIYGSLAPGLGQLYCGRMGRALFFFLASIFGFFLIYNQLLVHSSIRAGLTILFLVALFQLWSVIDAARCARVAPAHHPRLYQRWYSILGLALLFSVASERAFDVVSDNFQSFRITSASMEPALLPGDSFIVDKRHYWSQPPERGEVVVLDSESVRTDDGNPMVVAERVIAIEGDLVEVHGTSVKLNGNPVAEPYAAYNEGGRIDFPPQKVPRDSVFLLGDNRDHAKDGRQWAQPFTPVRQLIGRATVIYFNELHPERIGRVIQHTAPSVLTAR